MLAISTDEGVKWEGVRVRRVYRPAAEAILSPMSEHYLCINIGSPHHLTYKCEGSTQAGIRHTGDLVLTPAARSSYWRRQTEGEGLHLFVQPSLLAQVAESIESTNTELVSAFCVRDPQIAHIGFALWAEAEQGCPGGKLYGDAMATALAAHLLRRYGIDEERLPITSTGGLSPARLRRVVDFIQDNLTRDLSLVQIAAVAGISSYHFARQFRLSTGLSPHQYLIERRVERARQMLLTGRNSVSEIAIAVGFADQSHFARHFKRLLGTTPARFAKQ